MKSIRSDKRKTFSLLLFGNQLWGLESAAPHTLDDDITTPQQQQQVLGGSKKQIDWGTMKTFSTLLSFFSLSLSPNLKNERRRRRNCLQWVTKKEQLEKKRDRCEICTRCSSRININSLVFTCDFHKLMVIAAELILTYTVMTTD